MTVTLRVSRAATQGNLAIVPMSYDERTKYVIARELPTASWEAAGRCWLVRDTAGARMHVARFASQPSAIVKLDVDPELRLPAMRDAHAAPLAWSTERSPWEWQLRAHDFLAQARRELGAALLDCGMGTGKTRMYLDSLRALPASEQRALIIAPKAVVPVFAEQAIEHGGPVLTIRELDSSKTVAKRIKAALDALKSGDPIVLVMGWAVLQTMTTPQKQSLRDALAGATVIADEVHYAKGAGSSRSKNLAFISQRAAMRIGGSGTPLAHSPLDAYAVFRFLDPGVFGTSYQRFEARYAQVMQMTGFRKVIGYQNLDELAALMRPYTLTVTRDVLDLLPPQHTEIHVDLPPEARKVYEQLRTQAIADLESGTLIAANALSRLLRLAQVTSGSLPAPDGSGRIETLHDAKTEALTDLLDSCDEREPWVVFGRFHRDLDNARAAAGATGRIVFELSGRVNELAEWKQACKRGHGAVLATQMQAGGIGVSMTEARYCAYLSVGYSLAEFEQSLARTHRPGQSRSVTYYHVIARNTVDVDIRRALRARADVLDFVKGALLHGERAA